MHGSREIIARRSGQVDIDAVNRLLLADAEPDDAEPPAESSTPSPTPQSSGPLLLFAG